MSDSKEKKIVISNNGPCIVSGDIPLTVEIITNNKDGFSWDWKQGKTFQTESNYALCRCGHSKNSPFCDGTHKSIGFNGKETASKEPYAKQAQT
ncbi:MAG TPA: CDGSH iron-sulfur domain-containing protein, partial [Nitrosopumilaceae archaeon]|nr:CDGSH iron-sulfur domain-containing protein [Nitrosopumilaceae archaeon]